MEIIYRGKFKSLKEQQRRWLKGRQAVEPAIGHLKHDMDRAGCWGPRAMRCRRCSVLCAAGYNIRWLLRAIVRLGCRAFLRLRSRL